MKTNALFFTGVGQMAIRETVVPDPEPGEVLIETIYSCVSPGTELRCLSGKQANLPEYPFIPGYALVGRILKAGVGVTIPEGTTVFCTGSQKVHANRNWGGHIAHAIARADSVYPVPDAVDLQQAALTKLAAICLRGMKMSKPQAWESVAVIGLGPIGNLAARLHAISGARVVGVDTVADRATALQHAGIETMVATTDTIAATVLSVLPAGADIVVDATGYNGAANQGIRLARTIPWDDHPISPTRYLIQGSYPGDVSFPYDLAFQHELTVLFARDNRPGDPRTVLDLLSRKQVSFSGIVGTPVAPAEAPRVYAALQNRDPDTITALFDWRLV